MTPQPDAPDWRRLVSEAGAEPGVVQHPAHDRVTLSDGVRTVMIWQTTISGRWWMSAHPDAIAGPAEAIHAALNHLRAELRARMERDAAALERLGG